MHIYKLFLLPQDLYKKSYKLIMINITSCG